MKSLCEHDSQVSHFAHNQSFTKILIKNTIPGHLFNHDGLSELLVPFSASHS